MQDVISLDKLKIGEKVKINKIQSPEIPAKFYELGFYPGSLIEIKHKAPLNGPICVNILENNALIAIRKSEAKLILAEKIY
ncbi:FeoA family protein [Sphingobacterium humi]|uniref:Ferrous iron transport protein A n=1 Tax=Sphingobacterium humi TaxID=1796905 RepID=A0A6N8KXJ8_9SPHI|nr:FeoA family protein [Sphingobacterium humi]MVZ61449.1 ferrous iron transport protein A [Sphingobacterium humi]